MSSQLDILAQWSLLAADHQRGDRFMVFSANAPQGRVATTKAMADYQVALERESGILVAVFSTGLGGELLEVHGVRSAA